MPLPAHRPQCEMPTRQWGDLHSTRMMVVFAVMFTFANDQSLQFSARRGLLQSVAEGCRLGSFKLANSPLGVLLQRGQVCDEKLFVDQHYADDKESAHSGSSDMGQQQAYGCDVARRQLSYDQ